MDPDSTQQLIILVLLLLCSAFFSAAETAYTSVNKLRLKHLVESGVKNAAKVEKIANDPKKLLSTILIGNNIANVAASSLTTSFVISLSGNGGKAIGIATGAITLAILVFGEITPKTFSAQNAIKICLLFARPIELLLVAATPLVFLMNLISSGIFKVLGVKEELNAPSITESELKTIVNMSHMEGVIEVEESRMIHNVFDFGDTTAKDVMTPRTDMVAVSIDDSLDEVLEVFKQERFSRLPVYKDNTDNIVGIIFLKDFALSRMSGEMSETGIKDCMRPPYFTYEAKPISLLFATMKKSGTQIAVVLDEYGGTSGIVTIEDLVEEIVGDITDEDDEDSDKDIKKVTDSEYVVAGSAKISDVNDTLDVNLKSEDYESIGGYIISILERFPDIGEVIESDGLRFIVEKVDKNRIDELRIQKNGEYKPLVREE